MATPTELPDRDEIDAILKVIDGHAERIFLWDYDRSRDQLVTLYNKGTGQVEGAPFASWGDKEFTVLGVETYKSQLSQFMHGEQGAMMAAAKIVETVSWIDAKYYAADYDEVARDRAAAATN